MSMKRFLALILAFGMLMSLIPAEAVTTAFASSPGGTCGEDIHWELNDGTLTISGTGSTPEWDGDEVPWDEYWDEIVDVVVTEGIERITNYSFTCLESMTTLSLPASLETFDNAAVHDCRALETITVAEDNMYFSAKDGVLFDKDKTTIYRYPSGSTRTYYRIPDTVTTIGEGAFDYNSNLKILYIANNVENIYGCAFGINNIEKFIVAEENDYYTTDEIGVLYNTDMTLLIAYPCGNEAEEYSIFEGVTGMEVDAFNAAYNLKWVTLPESLEAIPSFAFANSGLEEIIIPENVSYIGFAAFGWCSELTEVHFGHNYIDIAEDAFEEYSENLTFYGYSGTSAEDYAYTYGIPFVHNDGPVPDGNTTISGRFIMDGFVPTDEEINIRVDMYSPGNDTNKWYDTNVYPDEEGNFSFDVPDYVSGDYEFTFIVRSYGNVVPDWYDYADEDGFMISVPIYGGDDHYIEIEVDCGYAVNGNIILPDDAFIPEEGFWCSIYSDKYGLESYDRYYKEVLITDYVTPYTMYVPNDIESIVICAYPQVYGVSTNILNESAFYYDGSKSVKDFAGEVVVDSDIYGVNLYPFTGNLVNINLLRPESITGRIYGYGTLEICNENNERIDWDNLIIEDGESSSSVSFNLSKDYSNIYVRFKAYSSYGSVRPYGDWLYLNPDGSFSKTFEEAVPFDVIGGTTDIDLLIPDENHFAPKIKGKVLFDEDAIAEDVIIKVVVQREYSYGPSINIYDDHNKEETTPLSEGRSFEYVLPEGDTSRYTFYVEFSKWNGSECNIYTSKYYYFTSEGVTIDPDKAEYLSPEEFAGEVEIHIPTMKKVYGKIAGEGTFESLNEETKTNMIIRCAHEESDYVDGETDAGFSEITVEAYAEHSQDDCTLSYYSSEAVIDRDMNLWFYVPDFVTGDHTFQLDVDEGIGSNIIPEWYYIKDSTGNNFAFDLEDGQINQDLTFNVELGYAISGVIALDEDITINDDTYTVDVGVQIPGYSDPTDVYTVEFSEDVREVPFMLAAEKNSYKPPYVYAAPTYSWEDTDAYKAPVYYVNNDTITVNEDESKRFNLNGNVSDLLMTIPQGHNITVRGEMPDGIRADGYLATKIYSAETNQAILRVENKYFYDSLYWDTAVLEKYSGEEIYFSYDINENISDYEGLYPGEVFFGKDGTVSRNKSGVKPFVVGQDSEVTFTFEKEGAVNITESIITVLDSVTNLPIANAEIYIDDGNTVYTDSEGKVTAYLPDGPLGVTVYAPGYRWNYDYTEITDDGENFVNLYLYPETGIRGKIIYPDDAYIEEGVKLDELNVCIYDTAGEYVAYEDAIIDNDLNYFIEIPFKLSPGEYTFSYYPVFTDENGYRVWPRTNVVIAYTYYVDENGDAKYVEYDGSNSIYDVDLTLETGYVVSGTVTIPENEIVDDECYINVYGYDMDNSEFWEDEGDYRFEIDCVEGQHSYEYYLAVPKNTDNLVIGATNTYFEKNSYANEEDLIIMNIDRASRYTVNEDVTGIDIYFCTETSKTVDVTVSNPYVANVNFFDEINAYLYAEDVNCEVVNKSKLRIRGNGSTTYREVVDGCDEVYFYYEILDYSNKYKNILYKDSRVYINPDGTFSTDKSDAQKWKLKDKNKLEFTFATKETISDNISRSTTFKILDKDTNLPISDASITIGSDSPVYTDRNGVVKANLSNGPYDLIISATGYESVYKFVEITDDEKYFEIYLTQKTGGGNTDDDDVVIGGDADGNVVVYIKDGESENFDPVSGALVVVQNSSGELVKKAETTSDGIVRLKMDDDTYNVTVSANGYDSRSFSITRPDTTDEYTVYLYSGIPIKVETSVREMSLDDIINAGIDINAVENTNVYQCTAVFDFAPDFKYSYICTDTEVIKADRVVVDNVVIEAVSKDVYLVVKSEVSWLKEMFEVQLVAQNTSRVEVMKNFSAHIDLPEGLSLATMLGEQQSADAVLGDVAPNATASHKWFIRGDKEGSYLLNGVINTTRSGGGIKEDVNLKFSTQDPIIVVGGSALHLTIEAEKKATVGQPYRVRYTLENVSNKTLYNVAMNIFGGKFLEEFTVDDYKYCAEFGENGTRGLSGEYKVSDKDFESGEKLSGVFEITFGQGIEPDYMNYVLERMFIFTGAGSNVEIPTTIIIVDDIEDSAYHMWDEGRITTQPTCTEKGIITYNCIDGCGVSRTVEIDALGHNMSDFEVVSEADCTSKGIERSECARCDYYVELENDALGHDWEDYNIITQPTCTTDGYGARHCKRCDTRTEETIIPAIGHNMSYWHVSVYPTCTSSGSQSRSCLVCGYEQSRSIDPLGHKWDSELRIDVYPTCTQYGEASYHCLYCDATKGSTAIDPLGHKMGNWETTVEPTCTKKGEKVRSCTRCTYTETGSIDAKGHNWDEGVITKYPTTEESGRKTYTCQNGCGETWTDIIPKLLKQEVEFITGDMVITYGERKYIYNQAYNDSEGGSDLVYKSNDESVATVDSKGKVTVHNAGETIISATAAATDKYVETAASYKLTVKKADLTVTADDVTICYGQVPVFTEFTATGLVFDEDKSVLEGTPVFETDYKQYDFAGEYDISISGLTSRNYNITFADGKLIVNKATEYSLDISNLHQKAGKVTPVVVTITPDDPTADFEICYSAEPIVNTYAVNPDASPVIMTREVPQNPGIYDVTVRLIRSDNIERDNVYHHAILEIKRTASVETGNGELDIDIKTDENNNVEFIIDDEDIENILNNLPENGDVVIDGSQVTEDANRLTFSSDFIDALDDCENVNSFTLITADGEFSMDADVLETVAEELEDGEKMSVYMDAVDKSKLNEEQRKAIESIASDSVVLQLNLFITKENSDGSTSERELHELNGNMKITTKYSLPASMEGKKVTVLYVDENGVVTFIRAKYENGYVSFSTDHFSYFAIAAIAGPEISVSDIRVMPGKEFQVTVDLAENTGFANLGIEIGYDSDAMTLVKAQPNSNVGATYTPAQNYSKNPYNMSWDSTNNVEFNGTLATLTFKVGENVPDGIYPITVDYYKGVGGNYVDGDNVNYDEDFEAVGFVYIKGDVIVARYIPGDINGDECVDNKDATYILRYLAGWDLDKLVSEALDTDGSGIVDNKDATVLLRFLAGWDVELK